MATHGQSQRRQCAECGERKGLGSFWTLRGPDGVRHRTHICRDCQKDAEGWPPDSPWMRAEREVERRYGIPAECWLATGSALSLLHTALAIEYAKEGGASISQHLTVEDCEVLCNIAGYHRLDHTTHQGESHAVQQDEAADHAAA